MSHRKDSLLLAPRNYFFLFRPIQFFLSLVSLFAIHDVVLLFCCDIVNAIQYMLMYGSVVGRNKATKKDCEKLKGC